MRKPPMDDASGMRLVPPAVEPHLGRRLIDGKIVPLITQVRRYELITPLLGGGVEPGEADPVTVIRVPEIRGNLRFWWRACRGGKFHADLLQLKEYEGCLWGAASTEKKPRPSKVAIVVRDVDRGREEQPFETKTRVSKGWRELAYAAFPLQGDGGNSPGKVRAGVAFTLVITFPELYRDDVEAALWAWETFGGIGGRTRRGFGALKLVSVDTRSVNLPTTGDVETEIRNGLQSHVVSGTWPKGVPHVSVNLRMKVTGARKDPEAAWELLIQGLRNFRQCRSKGAAPNRPGRSHWPEPDAIREFVKRRCPRHAKPLSKVGKFPRGSFGLPVVFHFKDQNDGDPTDTTLQGRTFERMASPLILRPLACVDGQASGMAVILEGTGVHELPGGLVLHGAPGDPEVEASLEPAEASTIEPLHGNPDVLYAFLNKL